MSQTTTKALPNSPEQRVLTPIFSGVAKIVAKERYRNFCRLTIRCPEIAARAQPGQFVNLYLDGLGGGASFERSNLPMAAILPRPFSVAKIVPLRKGVIQSDEPQAFSVLFDIRGVGTNWLAQLTTDVPVRVSGPLGKGFWLPEGTKTAVLVAGGIGIAPFPFLAERLKAQGVETVLLLGAKAKDKLPFDPVRAEFPFLRNGKPLSYWGADEFESIGVRSAIALEEPEDGFFAGTVTQLFEAWLSTRKELDGIVVYGCGPIQMLKALIQIAQSYNLPCQVSLEERMGCGMGICFGCPIPVKDGGYKLCCTEGPVFDASELAL
jgi:dihydroorotate dehydrogenase electron transfer subunit